MGLYISNYWSSHLIDLIKDVKIAGLERSVKFSHRMLNFDRYIMGPEHSLFSAVCLKTILEGLNFPDKYLTEALIKFRESNQSGFGFEQYNGVSTYRLYLEFFDRYKPDPSLNRGLIHIGYKWQCDNPGKMTKTYYNFEPSFSGDNPEEVIRKSLLSVNEHFVQSVVSASLKSLADIAPTDRIMTCAFEERGCRRSFDLNVYRSRKQLKYLQPELSHIGHYFRIEKGTIDNLLAGSGDAVLGHIACGMNSINDPFFTVYFDDFSTLVNMNDRLICV